MSWFRRNCISPKEGDFRIVRNGLGIFEIEKYKKSSDIWLDLVCWEYGRYTSIDDAMEKVKTLIEERDLEALRRQSTEIWREGDR